MLRNQAEAGLLPHSLLTMPPKSAIPDFYYFCFGAYEPFITFVGFLGAIACVSTCQFMLRTDFMI